MISTELEPWELTKEKWAAITDSDWFLLRRNPYFRNNWNLPAYDRQYVLIKTCMFCGMFEDPNKIMTVIKIWHKKHQRDFDEADFWRIFTKITDEVTPIMHEIKTKEYWREVQRIQRDKKAKAHNKMRVAYFIWNRRASTAQQVSEATGIQLASVRRSISTLCDEGKLLMTEPGVYRGVPTSIHGILWKVNADDDHPVLMNERVAANYILDEFMGCWSYTRDRFFKIERGGRDFYVEWVIDENGTVVANGYTSCVEPIKPVSCSDSSEDFDFFRALSVYQNAA